MQSSLVLVPTLVKTKAGELVFSLSADDFLLTDDGVPQSLRLEADTDSEPLALVVVVETGGEGIEHLHDYAGRDALLDAIIGAVPHHVAVVGFDSQRASYSRLQLKPNSQRIPWINWRPGTTELQSSTACSSR